MPIYNYRCDDCQKEYSLELSVKDLDTSKETSLKRCPKCKSSKGTRIIKQSVPVVYKGDGFTLKANN